MSLRIGNQIKQAALCLKDAGIASPLLDAQLLMANVLKCSREHAIAHPERILTEQELAGFSVAIEKRASRYPLAYILGRREFFGIELEVSPAVLIPRPETEVLVEECLRRMPRPDGAIADIGTGSGAIAVALAMSLLAVRVHATDNSPEALKVARANAEKHQVSDRVTFLAGDMLKPIRGLGVSFDAVVSNPPYVPEGNIAFLEPEVRLYEPIGALDGGPDGLHALRCLIPGALDVLAEGGFVAVEVGAGQARAVEAIAFGAGFRRIEIASDLAGIERVVVAYG